MKKITAVILAASVFFALLSSLCLADRVVGGENPDLSDGVSDIPQGAGSSSDIQVAVTEVASRYAVDVTFPDLTLVFGDIVWNVDSLSYEVQSGAPDGLFEIAVTNHSDRPVLMWGNVEKADPADGISVFCSATSESKQRIPAVRPQAQNPQEMSLFVEVSASAGWGDVLAYLMESGAAGQGTYRIGTVSVWIAKTAGI